MKITLSNVKKIDLLKVFGLFILNFLSVYIGLFILINYMTDNFLGFLYITLIVSLPYLSLLFGMNKFFYVYLAFNLMGLLSFFYYIFFGPKNWEDIISVLALIFICGLGVILATLVEIGIRLYNKFWKTTSSN